MNIWKIRSDTKKAGDIAARFRQELRRQADSMLSKAIYEKKLTDLKKDIADFEKELDEIVARSALN